MMRDGGDDWASTFSTSVQAVTDEQTKMTGAKEAAAAAKAAGIPTTAAELPYVAPTKVTVKPGDTLSQIAKDNGMTLAEIRAINPAIMDNPKYKDGNMIWSGTKIVVDPGSGTKGTKPATSTPATTTPATTTATICLPLS
jgi:LysM repeat protein